MMKIRRTLTNEASAKHLKRNQILCPKCRLRIIDASGSIRTQILTLSENQISMPDFYVKCSRCGSEIGIKKVE